ncbi:hypothetical protein [Mariniphaga sediminis]|uniref:hypothetical protein n=1 Tax=Mariniphaga sediminis TaxID=1628158 RepID=UPI0035696F7B
MQEKFADGSYGEPRPFNQSEMEELVKDPNVEHVEVFEGTEKEIARRRSFRKNTERIEAKARAKRRKRNKQSKKARRR